MNKNINQLLAMTATEVNTTQYKANDCNDGDLTSVVFMCILFYHVYFCGFRWYFFLGGSTSVIGMSITVCKLSPVSNVSSSIK